MAVLHEIDAHGSPLWFWGARRRAAIGGARGAHAPLPVPGHIGREADQNRDQQRHQPDQNVPAPAHRPPQGKSYNIAAGLPPSQRTDSPAYRYEARRNNPGSLTLPCHSNGSAMMTTAMMGD